MKSIFFLIIIYMNLFADNTRPLLSFKNSEEILNIIEKYLPEEPIIVEAGAFKGADTVKMAKKWTKGKIFSFEPVPELYDLLTIKTKPFFNIKTFPLAIGQTIGLVEMYISEHTTNPGKAFASSSLLLPKEHVKYAPHVKFPKTIKVASTTFDAWANHNHINLIDFMWLEMQGCELCALKACPKILNTVKVILTELIFVEAYESQHQYKEIKEWLEDKEFEMIAIDKQHGWFGSGLFVKKSLL